MAVRLVERHSPEFQPQPAVSARRYPRQWLRPSPAEAEGSSTVSRHGRRAILVASAAAALAIAAVYVSGTASLPGSDHAMSRLALAAAIGIVVSGVHARIRGNRPLGFSLARAQILLCVAGSLTMILIDNSVARAFGIAGAASIVRFRTPVEDPTDATVLFLLMAIGMASGVGAFGVSLAGGAGVCVLLATFGAFAPEPRRRNVTIELVGTGVDFPTAHVQRVFARHAVAVEPAEWSQDTTTRVKYRVSVDEAVSLEALGAELMNRGEGALQSVTWEVRKNSA